MRIFLAMPATLVAACLLTAPLMVIAQSAASPGASPANPVSSDATAGTAANSGSPVVVLPLVPVEGQSGEPLSPGASSSVGGAQLHEIAPTATSDILLGMPGVSFQNTGAPGLSVSVRGLQDFGRVNVMIDGARQDFMVSGHGANSSVYVDPALLAGINVTRGTVSTGNGAGAIGGVVNLHTIGIDDVLQAGEHYGALTTDLYGTNRYDGSGMIAGGVRVSPVLDVMAAFSLRSSGSYEDGDGNLVPNTGQHLQSGLVKADIVPGADQTLQVGGIFYHNTFGTDAEELTLDDTIESTTATVKYTLAPAANPWIDLHVDGSYTGTRFDDLSPPFLGVTEALPDNTHYRLNTFGIELDNTSRVALGATRLEINYGGEYYHDAETTTDATGDAGITPSGHRGVASGFGQATLNWRIVQLIGGVRYDAYSLNGSGVNETGGITSLPAGPFTIDKSAGAVSPKITLAVSPMAPWLLYANYGLGFRPPALTETLMEGAHAGLGFLRFVPNPDLDPERTHGWEVGSKLATSNLLTIADALTFKADYFRTDIRHYIDQTLVPSNAIDPGTGIPIDGYFFENLPGNTVTKGFELEGEYDRRTLFVRFAYSNILTELGTPDYTGFTQIATAPPRSVFSGTVGLRLLAGRLIIGERTRAVSRTTGAVSADTGLATTTSGYVVEDLFGSYQIMSHLKFFASIENVGDREYFDDALATVASPGLMAKVGFTVAL
jgi:hemoglobin/transferrin/lactoferrin receptor protein